MRVGIIGSRNCRNFQVEQIEKYIPAACTGIISGGAKGIDSLAQKAAEKLGLPFKCCLPQYEIHGRRATLIRNDEIVKHSDLVLAFWDFHSRGTAYTIVKCIEQHVEVKIIGLDGKMHETDSEVFLNSID